MIARRDQIQRHLSEKVIVSAHFHGVPFGLWKSSFLVSSFCTGAVARVLQNIYINVDDTKACYLKQRVDFGCECEFDARKMNVVESYMRELHKLAGTCTGCENLCCDFGMSVEVEQCSSKEQLESEETRTTAEILNDSRLTYTKAFMLSLSNLHICKALPEDFDPSALQESRLTYTKEFMLSLSNLQICKDLPKDFDPSVLRYSRLTYTKTFMLSLSNLQICEDLPKDFDPSILRELDGLSECMLGMQQTSTILPPYTSNNYYTGSSPVLRCDLVADSRLCCGRLGKQVSQGCCDSDSRAQNYCSGILGSFLSKSKNPYRPPQYYKVGGSNSYASHSSKGTKSLTNTAFSVQEDVQSKNDTFQDDVLGNKSTHWRKQIANLSEAQKSVIKFVDDEKSHCKTHGSINGAITTQQEQLLDSEPKASIAIINLEEFETRQFGESLEMTFR